MISRILYSLLSESLRSLQAFQVQRERAALSKPVIWSSPRHYASWEKWRSGPGESFAESGAGHHDDALEDKPH